MNLLTIELPSFPTTSLVDVTTGLLTVFRTIMPTNRLMTISFTHSGLRVCAQRGPSRKPLCKDLHPSSRIDRELTKDLDLVVHVAMEAYFTSVKIRCCYFSQIPKESLKLDVDSICSSEHHLYSQVRSDHWWSYVPSTRMQVLLGFKSVVWQSGFALAVSVKASPTSGGIIIHHRSSLRRAHLSSVSALLQSLSLPSVWISGADKVQTTLLPDSFRRELQCFFYPGVFSLLNPWFYGNHLSPGVIGCYCDFIGFIPKSFGSTPLFGEFREGFQAVIVECTSLNLVLMTKLSLDLEPPVFSCARNVLNFCSGFLSEANLFQTTSSRRIFASVPKPLFSQLHLQLHVFIGTVAGVSCKSHMSFECLGLLNHCYITLGLVENLLGLSGSMVLLQVYFEVRALQNDLILDYSLCHNPTISSWLFVSNQVRELHLYFSIRSSSFMKRFIPSKRESTMLILAHLLHINLCFVKDLSSLVFEEDSYPLGETILCVYTHRKWSSPFTIFGFSLEDVHLSTLRLMVLPSISVGDKPLMWLHWCLLNQPSMLIHCCRPVSQARSFHKGTERAHMNFILRVSKSTVFTGTRSLFPPSLPDTTKDPFLRAANLSVTSSYSIEGRIILAATNRVIDLNSRLHLYVDSIECVESINKHLSHRELYGVLRDIHILPQLLEALSSTFIATFSVIMNVFIYGCLIDFSIVSRLKFII